MGWEFISIGAWGLQAGQTDKIYITCKSFMWFSCSQYMWVNHLTKNS